MCYVLKCKYIVQFSSYKFVPFSLILDNVCLRGMLCVERNIQGSGSAIFVFLIPRNIFYQKFILISTFVSFQSARMSEIRNTRLGLYGKV